MTFARAEQRYPFAVRRLRVSRVTTVTPSIMRVTLTGPELEGFQSTGPNDHVKIFLPNPDTGVIVAPEMTPDGPRLPAGELPIARDYTPRAYRPGVAGGPGELDIDFVTHGGKGGEGPASSWATRAHPGAELVIAGPRGSRSIPDGAEHVVLIADETALPALTRWVELVPTNVDIRAVLHLADESSSAYLSDIDRARISRLTITAQSEGAPALLEAVIALEPITSTSFVFGAGEASSLAPVRAHLRKQLGLSREQVALSGYWRRGTAGLDHHAQLDPTDPD